MNTTRAVGTKVDDKRDNGAREDNTVAGFIAFAVDMVVVLAAAASVVLGTIESLMVWEAISLLYLAAGGVLVRYLVRHEVGDSRTGFLDTLSWVFPLTASRAGVNAALTALVTKSDGGSTVSAVAGALGIPISWLLLHVGFTNMYAAADDRAVRRSGLNQRPFGFPNTTNPGPIEYLYLALTVGATFATSDVEVRTRSGRALLAGHSVVSFFFNALVVAAAFQALQHIAAHR